VKRLAFLVRLYGTQSFYAIVRPVRRAYWFVVRPHRRGAKCVVTCDGEILLVKLNYLHRSWTFPGGGVHHNESDEVGALRELKEETGIATHSATRIGEYVNDSDYRKVHIVLFHIELPEKQTPVSDGIEISEAAWFRRDQLPENRVARVDFILGFLPLK